MAAQGPHLRAALRLRGVPGGVPLVQDLHRVGAEPLLALLGLAIPPIRQIRAEQPDRVLIAPKGRVRP
jgi:hypothetical protein